MARRMTWLSAGAAVAVIFFASTGVFGEDGDREDLSACKLPNGLSSIPTRVNPRSRSEGGLFSFSKGKLSPAPPFIKEGRRLTATEWVALIQKENIGDLQFGTAEHGYLFAISGRIVDLGKHYLYEFDGKDLARPEIVPPREKNDPQGALTGIEKHNGHCFLIETTEGKCALFRLVSQVIAYHNQASEQATIQWVYQPDGSRRFAVPKGRIIAVPGPPPSPRSEEPCKMPFQIDRLDVRDFTTAIITHMENNKKLVKMSIRLLSSKDATTANRYLACEFLGNARACEGASVLARIIDTPLSSGPVRSRIIVPDSYGCVYSLAKIGQPGAKAAIMQIEADATVEKLTGELDSLWKNRVELRRNLLTFVVLKVYGEKLGKIVLEDKISQAEDAKAKAAFQEALEAFPRIRNWLPEEKKSATRPKGRVREPDAPVRPGAPASEIAAPR